MFGSASLRVGSGGGSFGGRGVSRSAYQSRDAPSSVIRPAATASGGGGVPVIVMQAPEAYHQTFAGEADSFFCPVCGFPMAIRIRCRECYHVCCADCAAGAVHENLKTGETNYYCPEVQCGEEVTEHTLLHPDDELHFCSDCRAATLNYPSLELHRRHGCKGPRESAELPSGANTGVPPSSLSPPLLSTQSSAASAATSNLPSCPSMVVAAHTTNNTMIAGDGRVMTSSTSDRTRTVGMNMSVPVQIPSQGNVLSRPSILNETVPHSVPMMTHDSSSNVPPYMMNDDNLLHSSSTSCSDSEAVLGASDV